eukprot:CAMPEP_0172894660 /NCGR_PEP_ID=MMETSP1075-20121228/151371_1 /TAXON_ID=2916 /ORGANISM="Ceratium fusus, Strain PA161109" /LENGTH=76 /DNA_ID=CAMNT_0013749719 /DNA_START=94 /DNA_END=321 /DNA_ORIENTATION=+
MANSVFLTLLMSASKEQTLHTLCRSGQQRQPVGCGFIFDKARNIPRNDNLSAAEYQMQDDAKKDVTDDFVMMISLV